MATLPEQYNEYMKIIRSNEEIFKEEISQYDVKESLVQLSQLKGAIELCEYNKDVMIRDIKQINTALQINISDYETNKMSSEETIKMIKTWIPSISIYIEHMGKIENDVKLITRLMDSLLNQCGKIISNTRTSLSLHNQNQKDSIGASPTIQSSKTYQINNQGETQDNQKITDEPIIVCSYNDCPSCIQISDHTFSYCINKCVMCAAKRKISKYSSHSNHLIKDSSIKSNPPQLISSELINNSNIVDINREFINTNDKYYFILLTSHRDDGSNSYIVDELSKNFRSMFPNSFPAIAYCYSIGLTSENIPYLNGLIRYDSKGKYRISPKSSHIKNTICSMTTGTKTLRYYDVQNLTKYANRQYQTRIKDVRDKIIYIRNQGSFIQMTGNTEQELLLTS
jgi:hypothetical protein